MVKFQTTSNGKNNSVNMLLMDKCAKVFMVPSVSDLRLRGQRSKEVSQISNYVCKTNSVNVLKGQRSKEVSQISNYVCKTNSVNVLAWDKHAKVSKVNCL